ncbi:hypothetical protein KIN20_022458 [Parelaphostrongylus tenuis]|uniref:Uncharacterized protein n=1 Tax=Parelaphostrongylus tenuis TaxID=148309 RepID=A0AAD5N661_PARTN|nr:hypothetical protein KIN20_022458 [Parelaphostrongylus tenuis]
MGTIQMLEELERAQVRNYDLRQVTLYSLVISAFYGSNVKHGLNIRTSSGRLNFGQKAALPADLFAITKKRKYFQLKALYMQNLPYVKV